MHWTYEHTHVCLNADCEQEQRAVVGKMEYHLIGLGEKFSDGDLQAMLVLPRHLTWMRIHHHHPLILLALYWSDT